MKKTIKALKLPIVFLLILLSFIACDKDFSIIESDVLGKDNANFLTDNTIIPIIAYNKKLDSLQINGLASNLLGVFNDPAYGLTTASIVTQIIPSIDDPDFGDEPVIDSVILKIPYYTSLTGELDDKDNAENSIDSLYGSSDIKLSIYQNNYFLRDFNPLNIDESQNYYSNAQNTSNNTQNFIITESANINFDDHKGDLIEEIEKFTPNSENIYSYTYSDEDTDGDGELDVENIDVETPALRIKFDNTDFWKTAILDKEGESVLSNSSNFKDYFRGLYFKTENISDEGNMVLLNTTSSDASIIIYYTYDTTTTDDDDVSTTTQNQSTYSLSFSGNTLNTFINDYSTVPFPVSPDKTLGDERLYLKGTEGSMAVVSLFDGLVDCDDDGNVDDDALECFKKTYRATDNNGDFIIESTTNTYVLKKLINEAHLAVYEDDDLNTGSNGDDFHKYDRVYAYDIKNNTPIIDYSFDASANTTDPFSSYVIHLSQRDTIEKKFKIRLTEHLNNILLRDSTNTKIGLVLSTNVNYTTQAQILESQDEVTEIPAAAILTPRGTIFYGSNDNVAEDKRMKLKIFSTEPKEN